MAYSRFNYIATTELADLIHTMSGVTDHDLAAKFISDAERMVDAYAGPGPKFYAELTGKVTAATVASGATLSGNIFGNRRPNYWAQGGLYLTVANVPGNPTHTDTGAKRLIVASTSGVVTLASGFNAVLPVGTEFSLKQESAFPRAWHFDPYATPELPHLLKQAVAWQVEFGILEGSEEYGLGDSSIAADPDAGVQSRTYASGYSESRSVAGGPGARTGLAAFVAPKTRAILRQLMNATGYTAR